MGRKLPDEEAFTYYVGLGDHRSLGAVASKYCVTDRAVRKAAQRGNWSARLDKIEEEARAQNDRKRAETLAETRDRHLKMARAIGMRGAQALHAGPIETPMQGAKAIDMSIRLERLLLGEPTEIGGKSIEEVTRREVERFLIADPVDDAEDEGEDPDEPGAAKGEVVNG